jgi:hypothetical protein
VGKGGEGGGEGQGGEMTQTMYAHMNKRIIKKDTYSPKFLSLCHLYYAPSSSI